MNLKQESSGATTNISHNMLTWNPFKSILIVWLPSLGFTAGYKGPKREQWNDRPTGTSSLIVLNNFIWSKFNSGAFRVNLASVIDQ